MKEGGSEPKINTNENFERNLLAERAKLRRLALTRLNVPKGEVSELVQDTIRRALDSRNKYEERGDLEGWLFTIMKNLYIDVERSKQREQKQVERFGEEVERSLRSNVHHRRPDNIYEEAEELQLSETRVRRLLAWLPDEQRRVFEGYAFDDFSPAELATIPGMVDVRADSKDSNAVVHAVENRLMRAKRSLKQIIEDEAFVENSDGSWRTLPERERKVVELAYIQKLAPEQLAQETGWDISTVKGVLTLGVNRLRAAVEEALEKK